MLNQFDVARMARLLRGVAVWSGIVQGARSIRYGDVVLRVHGVRVGNPTIAREAADLDPDSVHLTVFRDGQELEVEFETSPDFDAREAVARAIASEGLPVFVPAVASH